MSAAFINPLARNAIGTVNTARAIKQWTRELLDLPVEAVVCVNELVCHVPGCPPKETVVLVMRGQDTDQVSVHQAMRDITCEDLAAAFALHMEGE
ncbi:hypothetical protein [Agrobacterium cavarae]|uniref:hypothetical protein n=1 Tax=Agrobacterium cavarae TaxID=2528239 RepID=UPI0028975D33|nr:hypothetical protein [Agrobacterium cavarae]